MQMLAEMNIALDRNEHDVYAEEELILPTTYNGFLTLVVVPLYNIIKAVRFWFFLSMGFLVPKLIDTYSLNLSIRK